MKAIRTTRPARRIPAARLVIVRAAHVAKKAAQEQAREDKAQQVLNPTPAFTPAPRLTALPGGLYWAGKQPVPAIGPTVQRRDEHPGAVKVLAYCHADGFLGLVTEPAQPAKRAGRKVHPRAHCVFSHQLAQAA